MQQFTLSSRCSTTTCAASVARNRLAVRVQAVSSGECFVRLGSKAFRCVHCWPVCMPISERLQPLGSPGLRPTPASLFIRRHYAITRRSSCVLAALSQPSCMTHYENRFLLRLIFTGIALRCAVLPSAFICRRGARPHFQATHKEPPPKGC